MRKPWAFLFSTLTITTAMLPALAGNASAAPVPNDEILYAYLLRVPLPDDEGELEVIPFAKYQKISEAFCTKDTMTATMLADIDKVYKNALPVSFGTPDAPKDPIREARLKVLKPADLTDKAGLTNEGRMKLCENPQVRADYYKALVQLIEKAGTAPSPTMQNNELTATDMWTMRLTGFKKAFGKLLSPTDI